MKALEWIGYKAKLIGLGVFGPPRLDDEHDPIVQLKEEHGEPTDTDGTHAGG